MADKRKTKAWLSMPFLGASTTVKQDAANVEQKHNETKKQDFATNNFDGRNDSELSTSNTNGTFGNGDNKLRHARTEDAHQRTAAEMAQMGEEEIIADYNAPIHMWVVSTLFPLIAGTFGPMASMFNVCAISTNWRIIVNIGSEATGHYVQDPAWLIAVNVVSLAIAIIANISLLGQMTSRLRYNISGPITIIGFFVSGMVDIILVAIATSILPLPDPNATYSEAFYYACFSGAIYVLLAFMLSVTAWGIWFAGYSEEFKLSLAQRSLMLQTILFLVYVLASAAVYSTIEGWRFLDGVYFVVVTLFTIGFGDLVPTTHLARSLFFPFAVGGIIFVGVIIANIRTVILESGAVKVSTRLVEKARIGVLKTGNPDDGVYKVRQIHGSRKRDTKGGSELERRKNEFRLMREIQRQAHVNNRLFSLAFALIAFCVLWFIGAVAFWKAETLSVDGKPWTYFESLYFTFVAQLTIGYGDYEPTTNSSKPIFVFWALIALPTLTVLIGTIGDAVSAVVNWYTTWVGEHAAALHDIFVALYQTNNRARDKIRDLIRNPDENKDPEDQITDQTFHDISNIENKHTVPIEFDLEAITREEAELASEKYRPYLMLRAAHTILDHLDSDPPKKYTFKEWTWLLKLLGENEETEDGHRRIGHPVPEDMEVKEPLREHDMQVWSWLGQESPLMSLKENSEPKWILRRMLTLLEHELKQRAERHIERDIGKMPKIDPKKKSEDDTKKSEDDKAKSDDDKKASEKGKT